METFKKILKIFLYPHIAIIIALVPVSATLLVLAFTLWGERSPFSIASYVVAAYTMTVIGFRVPRIIKFAKKVKNENKYIVKYQNDTALKMTLSLSGTVIFNGVYAIFQLGLGIYHQSVWFYSLAAYYAMLSIMRFFLLREVRSKGGERDMRAEWKRYRFCGVILSVMNLALIIVVIYLFFKVRGISHSEITTIALAAYTFTSFTFAVINIVKYRKYNSPVYSASRTISLASACVSMLTLEATMLTTFGKETMSLFERRLLLGISGGVISAFVIAMAIYMIVRGTKEIKLIGDKNGK